MLQIPRKLEHTELWLQKSKIVPKLECCCATLYSVLWLYSTVKSKGFAVLHKGLQVIMKLKITLFFSIF
jgi:hypothetical protein